VDELMYAWVGDRDTPVQMGLLGLFDARPFRRPDGTIDVARARGELAARAAVVAALRRRVVWTRLGEGRPLWVDDPHFDPLDHIGATALPAGTDVAGWAANHSARLLNRDRPLWRAEIVTGLTEPRFAVLLVLSHILADGLAAVTLAKALFDQRPDAITPVLPATTAPPLPSHARLRRERARSIVGALRLPRRTATGGHRTGPPTLRQFRAAGREFAGPEPATSLSRRIGPDRTLGIVRQPLQQLQRTGHGLGVTVNDLLLAAVTGGLRQLLTARGDNTAELVLRASVPAATGRADHQVMNMLVVGLPVGEPDPLRRLTLIHHATAESKARRRAIGGDLTDLRLPIPVVRRVMRWARRFGSRHITLAVTDVPGPRAPLWLAGAQLLSAVPIAPLSTGVPLSIAALSYTSELTVTINADAAITDLDVLTDGVAEAFATLHSVAHGHQVDPSLAVSPQQPPATPSPPR
jgi:WS/DGAT/MGAT family acyltransferase